MPGRPPIREKKRAPSPDDVVGREAARVEEQRKKNKEAFRKDEGHPEDLGEMLLKLGRRTLAHQLHVVHLVRDNVSDMRRSFLLRALDGSEERLELVTEQAEEAKAKSKEYFNRFLALNIDRLTASLEIHRGSLDYLVERVRQSADAHDKISGLVGRLAGVDENDIHMATVKAIVLSKLVGNVVDNKDGLLPKLSPGDKRKFLNFALGLSKDMPEALAALFARPDERRQAPTSADAAGEMEVLPLPTFWFKAEQIVPWVAQFVSYRRELAARKKRRTRDRGDAPSAPDLVQAHKQSFKITNESFHDKELAFYVGQCSAIPDVKWSTQTNGPWPDARFHAHVVIDPVFIGGKPWTLEGRSPPMLPMLQSADTNISVQWSWWFADHHQRMIDLDYQQPVRRYRVDVAVPATGKMLRLEIGVDWTGVDLKNLRLNDEDPNA